MNIREENKLYLIDEIFFVFCILGIVFLKCFGVSWNPIEDEQGIFLKFYFVIVYGLWTFNLISYLCLKSVKKIVRNLKICLVVSILIMIGFMVGKYLFDREYKDGFELFYVESKNRSYAERYFEDNKFKSMKESLWEYMNMKSSNRLYYSSNYDEAYGIFSMKFYMICCLHIAFDMVMGTQIYKFSKFSDDVDVGNDDSNDSADDDDGVLKN